MDWRARLADHLIFIDEWHSEYPKKSTFLLSHFHTDHLILPKRFKCPVLASIHGKFLVPKNHWSQVRTTLVPGTTFQSKSNVPIFIFQTDHAPESIGFLFPTLGVIYVGDAPMGPDNLDLNKLLRRFDQCPVRPLQIVYDNLYEQETRWPKFPPRDESCRQIRKLLRVYPNIHFAHHGLLAFVTQNCPLKLKLDVSVKSEVTRNAMEALDLEDDTSSYRLVGRNFSEDYILVSSLWFMHTGNNPAILYRDSERKCLRVFCSMHASRQEILDVKRQFSHLEFHPVTKKLV
jgi:hypothetical protein